MNTISKRIFLAASVLGFLSMGLAAAASFTTFDVPGARLTYGASINSNGDVTGSYVDSSGVSHGFLRSAAGAITTFDAPGTPAATFPTGVNGSDTISGYTGLYPSATGFVRSSGGAITVFSGPNSAQTIANGINTFGDITGYYVDTSSGTYIPYIRSSDGTLTAFTGPSGSVALAINDNGDVIGDFGNAGVGTGYIRTSDGTITTFVATGVTDTVPTGINNSQQISGFRFPRNALPPWFAGLSATALSGNPAGASPRSASRGVPLLSPTPSTPAGR